MNRHRLKITIMLYNYSPLIKIKEGEIIKVDGVNLTITQLSIRRKVYTNIMVKTIARLIVLRIISQAIK